MIENVICKLCGSIEIYHTEKRRRIGGIWIDGVLLTPQEICLPCVREQLALWREEE